MGLDVNADRLWRDLMELGSIGATDGGGLTRFALSDAHMEARKWLLSRMQDAGLKIEIDPAMNVIGRMRSNNDNARTVMVGSHLDTVPNGGRFDGALGVVAGLECARVFQENGVDLPFSLEIVDFTDEEGFHNAGTIGSRAMVGKVTGDEINIAKMPEVPTLAEGMRRLGYDPSQIVAAKRDLAQIEAYLELHIEQGARLDEEGYNIGAVTGIVGIYRYAVTIKGEANHAGTTPMNLRKDALVMAAPLFQLLPQWVRARNAEMVGTIGLVKVEQGAMNIIPGECRFIVELRSMVPADMASIRDLLIEWVSRMPGSSVQTILEKDSVNMNNDLIKTVVQAAEQEHMTCVRMASGAGHDAQSFAPYLPTGMIFVPSRLGKSHCPDEWTDKEQVTAGCQVLLHTIEKLASSGHQ